MLLQGTTAWEAQHEGTAAQASSLSNGSLWRETQVELKAPVQCLGRTDHRDLGTWRGHGQHRP